MKFEMMIKKEFDAKFLLADMEVRYWDDAVVNGKECNIESNDIPLRDGNAWRIYIEIETGRVINWPEGVDAMVHFKVCDAGAYSLFDEARLTIIKRTMYVPKCLCIGENGYGDYAIMHVKGDGFIEGWDPDISDIVNQEPDD